MHKNKTLGVSKYNSHSLNASFWNNGSDFVFNNSYLMKTICIMCKQFYLLLLLIVVTLGTVDIYTLGLYTVLCSNLYISEKRYVVILSFVIIKHFFLPSIALYVLCSMLFKKKKQYIFSVVMCFFFYFV